VKFTNLAIRLNEGYSGENVHMGMASLGAEWRYYKKELDKQRRAAKKAAERAAGPSTFKRYNDKDFGLGGPPQRFDRSRDRYRDDSDRRGPPRGHHR
jgi:hypothetical protein